LGCAIAILDGSPLFLANLNLILQAVIFALLGLALFARYRHNLVRHAVLMGTSIGLHTVAILAIMVPSILSMDGLLGNLHSSFALLTLTHAGVGSLVEMMGVWLLAAWLTNTARVEKCVERKNIMRITVALWIAELMLGIYIYMMLYFPP
jgi:uncharacterized membrane protein YozB (DUF420 family)